MMAADITMPSWISGQRLDESRGLLRHNQLELSNEANRYMIGSWISGFPVKERADCIRVLCLSISMIPTNRTDEYEMSL